MFSVVTTLIWNFKHLKMKHRCMSKEKAISEVSVKIEQFIRQIKKKTAGFPIFKIFFIKGLILIGFRMEI